MAACGPRMHAAALQALTTSQQRTQRRRAAGRPPLQARPGTRCTCCAAAAVSPHNTYTRRGRPPDRAGQGEACKVRRGGVSHRQVHFQPGAHQQVSAACTLGGPAWRTFACCALHGQQQHGFVKHARAWLWVRWPLARPESPAAPCAVASSWIGGGRILSWQSWRRASRAGRRCACGKPCPSRADRMRAWKAWRLTLACRMGRCWDLRRSPHARPQIPETHGEPFHILRYNPTEKYVSAGCADALRRAASTPHTARAASAKSCLGKAWGPQPRLAAATRRRCLRLCSCGAAGNLASLPPQTPRAFHPAHAQTAHFDYFFGGQRP